MKRSKRRNYWKGTLKNKIYAVILLAIGGLTVLVDHDATGLMFLAMFAVPLFFAKENWIM